MKKYFYIGLLLLQNFFLQTSENTQHLVTAVNIEPVSLRDQVAQYLYQDEQKKLACIQKIKDDRTAALLHAAQSLDAESVDRVALKSIRNDLSKQLDYSVKNETVTTALDKIKKRHKCAFFVCGDFVTNNTINTEKLYLKQAIDTTLKTEFDNDEVISYAQPSAPLMSSDKMN